MSTKSNRTPKEPARPVQQQSPEALTAEDVLKRVPLLRRVLRDIVETSDTRKRSKERLEELTVISRKFSSCEIEETLNSLRREVVDCERSLDAFEREIRDLGGLLKDAGRGLVYFYSFRDNRKVFLIWELREPDLLSWHELDETFSDRMPVEIPAGARASSLGYPDRD